MIKDLLTPEFSAGICSGFIQNVVGHPLDTIKVLSQNKKLHTLNLLNIYKGFSFPLYKLVITNSIAFDLNERLKSNNITNRFITGAITGATISPIVYFFDVFKIKKQNNMKYNFRDFIKPQCIYLSFLRETIAYSVYFGSYFGLKDYGISPFFAGGIAGCINWTSTYPIDTIKTRAITFDKTIKEYILMGNIWKGYRICIFRAFLVNSAGFQTYELALKYINNYTN